MPVRLPALLIVLAMTGAAGCVPDVGRHAYIAREERRFTVTGVPDVRLVTFDGSVEVHGWDRNEVLVEVDKRGPTREAVESLRVTAEQVGSRVQVEVRRPARTEPRLAVGLRVPTSARLVATVPRRANVFVRTGDGSIRAAEIDGRIELRAGAGSIRGQRLGGRVLIDTDDGSVSLEDVEGAVTVRTGDGGVSVTGRLDAVHIATGDGSVAVRAEPGSRMAGDWEVSTGDGGIVVYLPEPFDAELDASTGDGRVVTDESLALTKGRIARGALGGRLGAGGHRLRLRTGDGSIHVRVS